MSDNTIQPLQGLSLTQNIINKIDKKTSSMYIALTMIFLLSSNLSDDGSFNKFVFEHTKELLRIFPSSEKLAVQPLIQIFKKDNHALFDLILSIPQKDLDNDLVMQSATLNILSNQSNDLLSTITFNSEGITVKNTKEDNIQILNQDLQNIIYTFFFRDHERIVLFEQEHILFMQGIISKMNVWQGTLTFFPEVNKTILIEDNSNNSERLTTKTLTETFIIKIRIDPFVVDPHAITRVSNEIVFLGVTRTIDFHKDLSINTTYAMEINYENEKNKANLNPKTGSYGTIIDWKNPLFNDLEILFKLLSSKYLN